jgi:hypothetical protein
MSFLHNNEAMKITKVYDLFRIDLAKGLDIDLRKADDIETARILNVVKIVAGKNQSPSLDSL